MDTAKIARRARHTQTAYTAILHAQKMKMPYAFIQHCKLTKEIGEPLRALHELESALQSRSTPPGGAVTGSVSGDPVTNMDAKVRVLIRDISGISRFTQALLLRAKWMFEADRFTQNDVQQAFVDVTSAAKE